MATVQIKKIIGWLLCGWIFLLPWQTAWIYSEPTINGAKWQYGTMAIYGTEILLWLIILIWAIFLFKERNFLLSHWPPNKNKLFLTLSIWFFIFWAGASIGWAGDRELAFYWWFKLLEAGAMLFLFLNLKISWSKIYFIIGLSGVFQAFLAFMQFVTQRIDANKWLGIAEQSAAWPGVSVVGSSVGRWLRSYGSLPHPNILGGFLVISLLLSGLAYIEATRRREKNIYLIFIVVIVSGLFVTVSRGAWVALFGGLIFYILMSLKNDRQKIKLIIKPVGLAVLLVVTLTMIYWPVILTRFSVAPRLESLSYHERASSLAAATEIIAQKGIWGVGVGNYTWFNYQKNSGLEAWAYQPAHNLYLLIWSELGIIGIFVFMFLCFNVFMYVWRRGKIGREKLALLIALLIVGLFEHYLWTSYFGIMLWWLVLALTLKEESLD